MDHVNHSRFLRASLFVVGGIAALSTTVIAGRSTFWQEGRPTTPSEHVRPVVEREIVLDPKVNAVLHLSFLISRPLVDGATKMGCRVASVLAYTDVNGRLQYDLAHASPAVPSRARNPIELAVGFDEGGVSADYRVHLEPMPSKAWIDVIDVDDLAISTVRR